MKNEFKLTEVGVIPAEWEVVRLGECASFRTGPFGSALHKSDYINDGIPVVNPMHIVAGKIEPTRTMTITEQAANNLADFRLKTGEIVIGRRGEMGRCAIVLANQMGWLCGTGSMIIRYGNRINAEFLQRVLSSPQAISSIEDTSVGTTMINLNQGTLAGLRIQLPPLPEQTAIATALSDMDALLAATQKRLQKKKAIKHGLMQELLRPREGWAVRRLGEVGTFSKGSGIRKDEAFSGDIPCVRYGELYTKHHEVIKQIHSFISKKVSLEAKRLKAGDILFAGSGETKEEIGKCAAFVSSFEAYAGGDVVIFSPTNTNSIFLGYLLNTPSIKKQKASKGQGDAVVHISASQLSSIEISLPPIETQTRIAQILTDADAEIQALETKLAKLQAQKQGMMQALLTGKIRLPA